ncbi:MAG TPA: hypothetical protein VGN88_11275, partial [Phycisphaerae bacterium]
ALFGYFSYFWQSASPNKRKVMGILRGVLLGVVLMLACRPQLIMEHEDRLRSVVAVWVDDSASMTIEDPYTGPGSDLKMHEYLDKVTQELKSAGASTPASGSGGAAARRVNRYELATATLADSQWLKDLTETHDILFFTGSGRAEAVGLATTPKDVDARIAQLKSVKPTGNSTDVPTVVKDILDRVQGQRLAAVVLLTDGQSTLTATRLDQAADAAQQANTKVFAFPMGQEQEPFDLKITTMRLPESTFTRDPVSARIHISGTGITQSVPVTINVYRKKPDGTPDTSAPLATKEVTLDKDKHEIDTDVPIRLKKTDPGKSERFDLIARIAPTTPIGIEERTLDNNEKARTVNVLDAQINVLYVEGYPRWEFRYLKNELIREPTVNISTLLLTADDGFTQDADPAVHDKVTGEEIFPGALVHFPDTAQDLNKYDVLIIGDVEPTYFSPLQQNLIIDWVKTKGGGLCWIAGNTYNPETYRETPMEVLLPVTPDEIDPRARILPPSDNTPFGIQLTAAGKETNLFRFFDDPEESWQQVTNLPDLYWYKPVVALKPGAIVLAMNPKRSLGGNPAPLLVMRQFGAGPVVFSGFGDTWRWRRYTGEPLFQSYWLQMCRLLYANKALGQNRRMELAVDGQVEIGNQIKVTLTVKDPTLSGQVPSDVPVMVVDKEGRTVQTINVARAPGSSGGGVNGDAGSADRLTGSGTASQLGDFTLQVKPGALPLEVPAVEFEVNQPQREFETVTSDVQSLRSITKKTGGMVVEPYRAEEIKKEIPDRAMSILHTDSEELWNKPFALILVVLLATGEWLVRKRAGLI